MGDYAHNSETKQNHEDRPDCPFAAKYCTYTANEGKCSGQFSAKERETGVCYERHPCQVRLGSGR